MTTAPHWMTERSSTCPAVRRARESLARFLSDRPGPRHRAVGRSARPNRARRPSHLRLIHVGVPFDLVGHHVLGRQQLHRLPELDGEVRQRDVPRAAFALHTAQRADRVGERNARVRPAHQQEIDLGKLELGGRGLLGRPLELARREMVRPHLRRDEDLVGGGRRTAKPLADLALVARRTSRQCRSCGSRGAALARPCARRCARADPTSQAIPRECGRHWLRRTEWSRCSRGWRYGLLHITLSSAHGKVRMADLRITGHRNQRAMIAAALGLRAPVADRRRADYGARRHHPARHP